MQRVIDSPLVWLVLQAALGVYLGVRWFETVPVLLVAGAVVYASRSRKPRSGPSLPGSYHGTRAARVLTIGVELTAVGALMVDAWGPTVGLGSFGTQCMFIAVTSAVSWALYQAARRAYPAGSD